MDSAISHATGHSAIVHMSLILAGERHRITHLGGDYCILATPIESAPADAEILVSVDGVEDLSQVYLPAGISATVKRTRVERGRQQPVNERAETLAFENSPEQSVRESAFPRR